MQSNILSLQINNPIFHWMAFEPYWQPFMYQFCREDGPKNDIHVQLESLIISTRVSKIFTHWIAQ